MIVYDIFFKKYLVEVIYLHLNLSKSMLQKNTKTGYELLHGNIHLSLT